MDQSNVTGISIVVPCLNEAKTIRLCIEEIKSAFSCSDLKYEIIIADNGSTDQSCQLSLASGARVVNVPLRGYGAALHWGIMSASYDVVVFGDADCSYPFIEIPKLIGPILAGTSDFVLGSRLSGNIEQRAMPLLNRYVGTPALSTLLRLIYRLPNSDCNSGMRALRKSNYITFEMRCPGMEYASEMLIRVAQTKTRYSEVPIQFRKDKRGSAPHLRRWRDGWRHLRFILGNAPSAFFIFTPALIGTFLLLVAFILSLQTEGIRYHSALGCIALSMPLLLFSTTMLLVKSVGHGRDESGLLKLANRMAENSAPFYVSILIYFLAFGQFGLILYQWYLTGFGELSEMGGTIRATILVICATAIFALDLGLGLMKIVPITAMGETSNESR